MSSVRIKYRKSAVPAKEGNLYYQIIINRTVRQIPTCYKLYADEWDASVSQVRCGKRHERSIMLKSIESSMRFDIERLHRIISDFAVKGVVLAAELVIDEYNRLSIQGDMFSFMGNIIARLKNIHKIRTAETYDSALRSFRAFRMDVPIHVDALTTELIEDYQAWLLARNISFNTVSFYMRILRAVYNRAAEAGLTPDRRPFRRVYTGVAKTIKRAISFSEIKKISTLDLSSEPLLCQARDVFMFLFITRGMSMIDAAFLKKSDLSSGFLSYRRHKTNQLLTIRWEKPMQDIVDRNSDPSSPYLLNIIDHSKCNERHNYLYVIGRINHKLKIIARRIGLNVPLTTYVARHTWASVAHVRNVPLSVISEGMGHDSETTTRIYLASLDTSSIDRANAKILKDLTSF